MTSSLFRTWLLDLDKEMGMQKRKVLLFIDNCTAHNDVPNLINIKVQFLPPNTTSKLQPFDQGIIQNFKCFYRKETVRKIIRDIESNTKPEINLLHAIRMADKAWKNVIETAIYNCFKKSGFIIDALT